MSDSLEHGGQLPSYLREPLEGLEAQPPPTPAEAPWPAPCAANELGGGLPPAPGEGTPESRGGGRPGNGPPTLSNCCNPAQPFDRQGKCLARRKDEDNVPCQNDAATCPLHCGAQLRKKPGQFCGRRPMKGRKRCHKCGGSTPSGVASPHFKHGAYSRLLPVDLRNAYQRAAADPDLLSLRNEVALLQVRLEGLVGRLATGEHGSLWASAREALCRFRESQAAGDQAGAAAALDDLGHTLEQGVGVETTWEEITCAIEKKGKVASREWKRMVDLRSVATAEQVVTMFGALAASVRKHCDAEGAAGQRILRNFAADVAALMHARAAGRAGGK